MESNGKTTIRMALDENGLETRRNDMEMLGQVLQGADMETRRA